MSAWWLVAANLARSPLRAVLLLLALGAGFHLATILQSIHASVAHGIPDDPYLMVFPSAWQERRIPIDALDEMRAVPGVVAVSTNDVMQGAYYRERRNEVSPTAVIVEDYLRIYGIEVSEAGRGCIRETRMGALVERGLARAQNWQVGDRIPILGGMMPTKSKNPPWPFVGATLAMAVVAGVAATILPGAMIRRAAIATELGSEAGG